MGVAVGVFGEMRCRAANGQKKASEHPFLHRCRPSGSDALQCEHRNRTVDGDNCARWEQAPPEQ
eukprot:1631331-Karenia_brevis.AAC.1